MMETSSQRMMALGTGTEVGVRAARTRYSRSTAWAVGFRRVPGGFLRRTYCAPVAHFRRYVGLD